MIPLIPLAMSLAQFAPQIAKYLTNSDRAADAAAKIVDIAQAVTGTANPEAAVSTIQSDSQAAMQFRLALSAQEADLDKAYLADRQSARSSNVAAGIQDKVFWLTCTLVIGVLGIEGTVLIRGLPDVASPELLGRILGTLDAVLMAAVFYTYGSSRGSKVKDESNADLVRSLTSGSKQDVTVSVPPQASQTVSVTPAKEELFRRGD